MWKLDGRRIVPGPVVGVDLSLTGPGLSIITDPWGRDGVHAGARAVTLDRVPVGEAFRGQTLLEAAHRVAATAHNIAVMAGGGAGTLVVMEALLLQSANGKAPERAAFWWMVRGHLECMGMAVAKLNPTTRRSLAMDAAAMLAYKDLPKTSTKQAKGKQLALASIRRRWPGVTLPDDNAADALVCAEVGAHALGFAGLPALEAGKKKILTGAIQALGVTKEEASR